jgi:hypothetical protein
MNKPPSIWHGRSAVVWAVAVLCLILSEALLIYTKFHDTPHWALSAFYLPLMITLPFSVGVNLFRKVTRLPAIVSDGAAVDACSLYFSSMVLVANAVVFMCIADSLLWRFRPK